MTTSDERPDPPPVDDPDWIKGLVAKALLQAAEDGEAEVVSGSPIEPPPAAYQPPPIDGSVRTPPAEAAEATATPGGTPLVIGRAVDDQAQPTAAAATATAVAETQPSDPVPVPTDDASGRDHVMVEEDATVEGFRSSDIRTVLEWLAVIVSALVVALVIKAFVLQAFWIPSESMESTVNKGDRILVNKLSYRLHDVRRGDLVVFKKLPGTPGDTEDLIKRAIALPGETIEVRDDGRIWIWGPGETPDDALLLQEPYLDPRNERLAVPSSTDSLSTDIWDESCANQPRTPGRCTLGADQFFMMGDNRNSSSDSRFFGPVPEDLIVGRAFLRIWPLGDLSSL